MTLRLIPLVLIVILTMTSCSAGGREIFQGTSPYHHVRVIESDGMRTLCFDDATETRVSIDDPLKGHFEYTEFFHMPWLWNTNIQRVLMIGLGGGSAQLAFEHYYPSVTIDTVEIDPLVVRVAKQFFHFKEGPRQKVYTEDGRLFLRRSRTEYDLIVLDAYTQGRYGSSIPQHLVTKEFFEMTRDRLSTNGVVAYNIIGNVNGWRDNIVGAVYRTMKSVYPQVYIFPARSSQNVVLIATRAAIKADLSMLRPRANELIRNKQVTLPTFLERLNAFRALPPANVARSPILTDDYAPIDGLATAR